VKVLQIVPGAVVLHHRGQLLVGRLSGSAASVAITPEDLPILAEFLQPANAAEVARQLIGRGVPRELLARRLSLFHQRGLLAAPLKQEQATIQDSDRLEPAGACSDTLRSTGRWRLPRNFSLTLTPSGMTSWSARTQRHYRLDPYQAAFMVSFLDGRQFSELKRVGWIDREGCNQDALAWFVDRGLLVTAGDTQTVKPVETQVPRQTSNAPTWRDIDPDDRIPVYFMPHMENHYPLALGMIYSAIQHWNHGSLLERFHPIPITYLPPKEFLDGPYRKFGRGVWLFSNYMWSDGLNLEVSRAVKGHDAGNICIHGGPSTPNYDGACREFMQRHSSVDIAVHGEGEVTAAAVLDQIGRDAEGALRFEQGLADIEGITFRDAMGELVRTAPRLRMREPDVIPSPYAEGVFDAYEGRVEAAIVETNRGCPFKCTFCDWGSATNQKVTRFEMDRVRGEIEWIGNSQVGVLWIADANFGMLKRDLEIAEWIVDVRRRTGFPREVVVNYTKNANERLAHIIKVFSEGGIISQGIISIQTSDEETLKVIDRENIKTEKYDELIDIFSTLGLPLSTDLMIGLPGITPKAFDEDLQRYIDLDVAVKAYPTQLLPNSPMAHPAYLEKYRIKTDDEGYLVSCSSYNESELKEMRAIYEVYMAADGYSTLRYVMRFLQWDYQIPAMRLLHDLIMTIRQAPDRYPAVTWVLRFFNSEKCMPGGWRAFYRQVGELIVERYQIPLDSALETALKVNEWVMPDDTRHYPVDLSLDHDFAEYFKVNNRRDNADLIRLESLPPASLNVSDPNDLRLIDIEHQQYDNHQYFWELHSEICRPQSLVTPADPVAQASAVSHNLHALDE